MSSSTCDFLVTPEREARPRRRGLTHALDTAMPAEMLAAYLASAGPFLDIVKLGWGLGYVDPQLSERAELCRRRGVLLSAGGTLLEIAAHQHKVAEFADWAHAGGVGAVEVSNGLGLLTVAEKSGIIAGLRDRFVVLAETGSKDEHAAADPAQWADEMVSDLESGATWVIAEGRESGTVGLYHHDGSVRTGLLDAILDRIAADGSSSRRRGKPSRRGSSAGSATMPTWAMSGSRTRCPSRPSGWACGRTPSPRATPTRPTMIADPVPNLMSRPYRGLSVQEVSFELTQTALLRWITGRNVYRRTAFVLVRNGSAGALIALGSRAGTELFGPVTQARVLALPAEVAMVDSPATDVGNASAMAEVAGQASQSRRQSLRGDRPVPARQLHLAAAASHGVRRRGCPSAPRQARRYGPPGRRFR